MDAFIVLLLASRKANQAMNYTFSEKDFSSVSISKINQSIFKVKIFSYGQRQLSKLVKTMLAQSQKLLFTP